MKVSVILPVYNADKYLVPCLESLLRQSIDEYEVICVDDGSTDESSHILDAYQLSYPDIFKVYHKQNAGTYKAREFGLDCACGEYVGFCDSDDIIVPEMYEILYKNAIYKNAEVSVCAFNRIDEVTGKIIGTDMTSFGNQTIEVSKCMDMLPVINTAMWNKLIKRDVALKHITFEVAPTVAEDMMFLLSIYPHVNKICFCSQPLYLYYVRKNSAISSVDINNSEVLKDCMLQTRSLVMQYSNVKWIDVVNLFAFINFGIIIVSKLSGNTVKSIRNIQCTIEQWLDKEFNGWNRNPFLKSRYVLNGHDYLIKPMLVLWLYKLKIFPVFMKGYKWITENLKIDVKW